MAHLRLAFMGTADFAVPSLRAIEAAGHHIAAVYSQPPRPAGRGQNKLRRSPVHDAADRLGLPVLTPETLRDEATRQGFAALGCDACVVVAYGLILPPPILAAPRLGCINLHPSLLPRWRGPAPIQRTIEAGDAETGVAVIRMDQGVDSGPILVMERVAVAEHATTGALHDELAARGARLVIEALDGLAAGTLRPAPQATRGVTHAAKLKRGEGALDWHRPALELDRLVRAFSPRPGAYFDVDGVTVRVLAAALADGRGDPGAVLAGDLTVACGTGALRLTRVQRAGGKAVDGAAFLRGARIAVGTVLR